MSHAVTAYPIFYKLFLMRYNMFAPPERLGLLKKKQEKKWEKFRNKYEHVLH